MVVVGGKAKRMIKKTKKLSVPENRGLQRFLYILSTSAKKLQELRQTVGLTGGITQLKQQASKEEVQILG